MILLDALHSRNRTGRPPIWLMRQAGRYLPQYRKLREQHSLLEMFRNPEQIADVTALPIDLIGVDAAILYSDILIVFDALGVEWDVLPGKGPVVASHSKLDPKPVQEALGFVLEGIKLIKQRLTVPLIGFCGGPFTIASYLIEGGSSRDFKRCKQMIYQQPEQFSTLLQTITDIAKEFVNAQVDAGVDVIQVFESWAEALPPALFEQFCLPYLDQIVRSVEGRVPTILFGKGSTSYATSMAALQPTCIGLDWRCDVVKMREQLPKNISIQGNLDPFALYAPTERLQKSIDALLNPLKNDPGFIFNLGHGILPDIPVDRVKYLVEQVKNC